MQEKFEVLTGRDQILKRSQMWIGSMDAISQDMFVITEDKATYSTVTFIPAFRKIIDEILDNALDALITNNNSSGTIKVEMTEEYVVITDDGPGIPVEKKILTEAELKSLPKEEAKILADSYIPQIAWTRLFSGSNFEDSEDKTTIGAHGLGSKCTSIFSKKFIGKTDDGKNSCTVIALNNLESSSCKVSKSSGKSGTEVKFWPDLERFNLTQIEDVYKELMYQRLLCLAISFPNIKFVFNKQTIKVNDKKFLSLFSEDVTFKTFDKGFIGVFPNSFDDFKYFSYVDGLNLTRGGTHVEYIATQIVTPIREKLEKTYKTIKPADIKNKLTLVVFMRDFPNPKFDSQTKETLTNSNSEISSFLNSQVDFEKFSKEILKNKAIIDPIVETFKLKEELKTRAELKKVKRVKVSSDKYMPPIGKNKTYLALCEGLCLENNTEIFCISENINVKVKNLSIGDYVLSHNQNIQQVVGKSNSLKECVKITTKSGKSVICSKHHKWFVYDTIEKEFIFREACDINLSRDKLISNKLVNFYFNDISIEPWEGSEKEKYSYKIYGSNFELATSTDHKFVIFDTVTEKFVIKTVEQINVATDKIVLLTDTEV